MILSQIIIIIYNTVMYACKLNSYYLILYIQNLYYILCSGRMLKSHMYSQM